MTLADWVVVAILGSALFTLLFCDLWDRAKRRRQPDFEPLSPEALARVRSLKERETRR